MSTNASGNGSARTEGNRDKFFHSKATKATKSDFPISDLCGLCGLVVQFCLRLRCRPVVGATFRLVFARGNMQNPESFANQRHLFVKSSILKSLWNRISTEGLERHLVRHSLGNLGRRRKRSGGDPLSCKRPKLPLLGMMWRL